MDDQRRAAEARSRAERDALARVAEARGAILRELDADSLVRAARVLRTGMKAIGARLRQRRRAFEVAALRAVARPGSSSPPRSPSNATRSPPSEARSVLLLIVGQQDPPGIEGVRRLTVERVHDHEELAQAATPQGFDLLAVLTAGIRPNDVHWLARLCSHVGRNGVTAAAGVTVMDRWGRPGRVASAGLDPQRHRGGLRVRRLGAGDRLTASTGPVPVAAVGAGAVVMSAADVRRVGLPQRAATTDGLLAGVTAAMTASGGVVLSDPAVVLLDPRVPDFRRVRWSNAAFEGAGPAMRRATGGTPLDLSIVVAAPNDKVAARWGDWHLAEGLRRSLVLAGATATVRTLARAHEPAARLADVQLVLRGLNPVRSDPGQRQILWIISHPEMVRDHELDDADLVLAPSVRLANHLRNRTDTPVVVFPQATDHRRFRPRFSDPRYRHDLAAVAKTRDADRPMVLQAARAGLRPAIYGSGWEGRVPLECIAGGYVANDDLPTLYASVDVLLNDHWPTMRSWGIVSNRIFDALACGTVVLSDHLPEIVELFGDAVATCESPEGLAAALGELQAAPAEARARAAAGRQRVLDAHTFDHRAATLLQLVGALATPTRADPSDRSC